MCVCVCVCVCGVLLIHVHVWNYPRCIDGLSDGLIDMARTELSTKYYALVLYRSIALHGQSRDKKISL